MKIQYKDLMMHYGVTIGKRFRKQEKQVFIEEVEKMFTQMGYDVSYDASTGHIKIGDITHADVVFSANYDTPKKVYAPNFLSYPLHLNKNLKQESWNMVVMFLLCFLLCVALYVVGVAFLSMEGVRKILAVVCGIVLGYLLFTLFRKQGNAYNFSYSTNLVCLHALAMQMQQESVAFLLLDHNALSNAGWKQAKPLFDTMKGMLFHIDSIAQGNQLVFAYREDMDVNLVKKMETLQTIPFGEARVILHSYDEEKSKQNALAYYRNMILCCSGEVVNHELVVRDRGSKKDIHWNESFLQAMVNGLLAWKKTWK